MTREEVLDYAKSKVLNHNLLLELPTGLGKTKISLESAFHYIKSKKKKKYSILILVAERAHIDNWKEEFTKWNFPLDNVEIACYASISKYENTSWTTVLLDEAHNCLSDNRLYSLSQIEAERFICATATIPKEGKQELSQVLGGLYNINVSLQDAIDNNILPIPKIVLVPSRIDEEKKRKYTYTITRKLPRGTIKVPYDAYPSIKFDKRYTYHTIEIQCNSQEYYDLLSKEMESFKQAYDRTGNPGFKNKWLRLASDRKLFLGEYKTRCLLRITDRLQDKRFICFCASIKQAEYVGKELSIHSKMNKPLELLKKYNNKEINWLYAIKMLREGQNLKDTQYGIITQLDSKPLSAIQMLGRILRHPLPVIYILYVEETQDEVYLKNTILKEIDNKYITTYLPSNESI